MTDESDHEHIPLIGPLQLRVLHAMWRHRVDTVHEVARIVNAEPGAPRLAYTTFLTVMRNLARRGLLRQEKKGVGKAHRFVPALSESAYKIAFIHHVLDDYCGGDTVLLMWYATEQAAREVSPLAHVP